MICLYYTTEPTDSRVFLTNVLETFYGVKNAAGRLQFGLHGKPYLKDAPVRFNLSHSGRLTAVAAGRQEVGLDVQRRDERPHAALSARLTPAEREEDLFRLWTAKEAYIKYRGGSLAAMLGNLRFENGVISDGETVGNVSLWFGEIEDCAVCICTERQENVVVRPI